jgi:hypothetical protein
MKGKGNERKERKGNERGNEWKERKGKERK